MVRVNEAKAYKRRLNIRDKRDSQGNVIKGTKRYVMETKLVVRHPILRPNTTGSPNNTPLERNTSTRVPGSVNYSKKRKNQEWKTIDGKERLVTKPRTEWKVNCIDGTTTYHDDWESWRAAKDADQQARLNAHMDDGEFARKQSLPAGRPRRLAIGQEYYDEESNGKVRVTVLNTKPYGNLANLFAVSKPSVRELPPITCLPCGSRDDTCTCTEAQKAGEQE